MTRKDRGAGFSDCMIAVLGVMSGILLFCLLMSLNPTPPAPAPAQTAVAHCELCNALRPGADWVTCDRCGKPHCVCRKHVGYSAAKRTRICLSCPDATEAKP